MYMQVQGLVHSILPRTECYNLISYRMVNSPDKPESIHSTSDLVVKILFRGEYNTIEQYSSV